MPGAASHPATGRALLGVYTNGRFLQEKGWDQGILTKEKKGLSGGWDILLGKRMERFLSWRLLLSVQDGEGPGDRLLYRA